MASTIITAPSTIKPKSIAPRLIKLALTPNTFINPKAKSIDSGIADATISPALKVTEEKELTQILLLDAPSVKIFFNSRDSPIYKVCFCQ